MCVYVKARTEGVFSGLYSQDSSVLQTSMSLPPSLPPSPRSVLLYTALSCARGEECQYAALSECVRTRSEGEAGLRGCEIKAVKVYNCTGSREKGLL